MRVKTKASEAEEQNSMRKENARGDNAYCGKLEESMMLGAGERLREIFLNHGAEKAKSFYTWLHDETKFYLRTSKEYSALIKRVEKEETKFQPVPSGKNKYVRKFEGLLYSGDYAGAESFFKTKLNNLLCDFRKRAAYCTVGRDYLRELCSQGRLEEAKELGVRFSYLGFDVFYEQFSGNQKTPNNKLNKAKRRS